MACGFEWTPNKQNKHMWTPVNNTDMQDQSSNKDINQEECGFDSSCYGDQGNTCRILSDAEIALPWDPNSFRLCNTAKNDVYDRDVSVLCHGTISVIRLGPNQQHRGDTTLLRQWQMFLWGFYVVPRNANVCNIQGLNTSFIVVNLIIRLANCLQCNKPTTRHRGNTTACSSRRYTASDQGNQYS